MTMKTKKQFFSIRNPRTGDYVGRFAKYRFNQTVIISKNGRNWKVKLKSAILDENMNFVNWQGAVINHTLWYRMFPSDKCTHWINVNDPNF